MSSYTYTDISVGFFDKAAELFRAYSDRMTFTKLDVEKEPVSQGYEPYSYDIVVASNVLHATASIQRTLEHTRQLLKPGGYLMLLELTNSGPIRVTNIMGGLPGWWIGADDGRKYGPTLTAGQWHSALRKAGFSGIDAITPDIDTTPWPMSIMASQAVDDRVDFLRRPLSISNSLSFSSVHPQSVVILGTGTLETARIAEEVAELLGRFCGKINIIDSLPTEADVSTLGLNPLGTTFINLLDIDSPIFKDMTAEKMDGLKQLFDLAKHILWITLGAQADEPYHMASIHFSRVISNEARHISLNHLDLSNLEHDVSKVIAEHLLRQCALDEWKPESPKSQLMWSKEPEMYLDHGLLKVPRIVANPGQTARVKSVRCAITKSVSTSSSNLSTSLSSADSPPSLKVMEEVLPVRPQDDTQGLVRVESSSLMALNVAVDTFMFLGVGKLVDDATKSETIVTLATTNSCQISPIASVAVGTDLTQSGDDLLIAVASELLAASMIQNLPSGTSMLVHCSSKHRFLAAALTRQAAAKAIRVTFTCSTEFFNLQDPTWIKLDPRAPRHVVRKALFPVKPKHFIDLTNDSSDNLLSMNIVQAISPFGYKRVDLSNLCRTRSLLPSYDREILEDRLKDAVSGAKTAAAASSIAQQQSLLQNHDALVIQLEQIHDDQPTTHDRTSTNVVHWPSDGHVKVQVRPLDPRCLFSQDKTYLLVGLTGQIGQSLCEWMIRNGAGCVVLTSRRPKADERWLESFQGTDATVKILAMDVTDKHSLEKVVNDIRASCPPIAGVANGAMVLHDSSFMGMSLDTMQKALGPKIDGSNNLDALFHDDDLDFFILFSSLACVIGNQGQSNYVAANGYLNSLARKRRKRGLAASTFDIGRVAGLGYMESAGQIIVDQLTRVGLGAICESDFHQIFAETIRAGYADLNEHAVVTTGIRMIRDDEDIQGPWFSNPLFSHCIVEAKSANSDDGQQDKKTMLPVSLQLSNATTIEEALEVITECFLAKIRVLLQIGDQQIDPETPLIGLGVDSLVAVEVRSWFLKELKADVPVLKIIGGSSLTDLCQTALAKLPEELVASIGRAGQGSTTAITAIKKRSRLEANPSSEETSDAPSARSSSPANFSSSAADSSATSTQLSSRPSSSENLADTAKLSAPSRFLKSEQLSFGQSRFWFLRHLLQDQTTFNVNFYYHVTGNLRVADLERSVRIITARHEALRTCFVADPAEPSLAFQRVIDSSPMRLEHKNINRVEDVAAEYAKLKGHVFDIANGELMRIMLLTLSSSSHYLLLSYHHILMDGFSFQVFLADLEKAYNGGSFGLGPSPRQFPDFSRSQREAFENGEMEDELRFWRDVFPDEQPPVLPLLPMARVSSRMPMRAFAVHQAECHLDPALATRVKSTAKAHHCTPFHFYLAAFKTMLFLFTNARDLTIGIADANRNDSDYMGTIGFFLNLLTLRFRREPSQRFADAVVEARSTTYTALGNSRLPFDVLLNELNVSRSSSHSPFFQAFFDYRQGAQEKHAFGNVQFEVQELHPGRTAYDITLDVTSSATDALVMFRAQKSLYDLTGTNLLLETYVQLLDVLSRDASISLEATPLFGEKQLSHAIELGRGELY